MEKHIISFGEVGREEALRLQLGSNILLLATWNYSNSTGIVTGKLLEYMMMNIPIIAVISGNVPNSKVKEIVEKCNLGFCYEQASAEQDYQQLKTMIFQKYTQYINNHSANQSFNQCEIEKYNYYQISKRLLLL